MKKITTILLLSLIATFCLFAESSKKKWRYLSVTDSGRGGCLCVVDSPEKAENTSPTFIPVNNEKERFIAMGGLRNVESQYYYGNVSRMYMDLTKNAEDPEIKVIYSWDELLQYVKGQK